MPAVEALKLFLVTVEEALPQVEDARKVEKRITESALKMAEQLIHTQSEFLQKVVANAGKSPSSQEDEEKKADSERPSPSQPLPPRTDTRCRNRHPSSSGRRSGGIGPSSNDLMANAAGPGLPEHL